MISEALAAVAGGTAREACHAVPGGVAPGAASTSELATSGTFVTQRQNPQFLVCMFFGFCADLGLHVIPGRSGTFFMMKTSTRQLHHISNYHENYIF